MKLPEIFIVNNIILKLQNNKYYMYYKGYQNIFLADFYYPNQIISMIQNPKNGWDYTIKKQYNKFLFEMQLNDILNEND